MRQLVHTPWLQPIQSLQLCTILWLISAQLIACFAQNIDDFSKIAVSVSCASALFLPMIIFIFRDLKTWQTLGLVVAEMVLVTIASVTCIVSGFQLLFLITALKAGVLLRRSGFIAMCIMAAVCFTVFTQRNTQVFVQANSSSNELVSLLLGREFVGFAVGMILVVVLVSAMKGEQENRKEAERLSDRLVSLATELERNRISQEINQKVDGLLQQVVDEVQVTSKNLEAPDTDAPLLSLKKSREMAANALTEVRRSLALLRDFENSRLLIILIMVSLSTSSCQMITSADRGLDGKESTANSSANGGKDAAELNDKSKAALAILKTGIRYQQSGRVELSRKALEEAMALDPGGKIGNTAKLILRTKLPRNIVSPDAEQRNIIGFNQMNHGDNAAAEKTFSALIKEFPQFEYPYGNLAYLYIQEKRLKDAKPLLQKVLNINPNYINAWKYLAEIQRIEKDRSAYKQTCERINALRLGDQFETEDGKASLD